MFLLLYYFLTGFVCFYPKKEGAVLFRSPVKQNNSMKMRKFTSLTCLSISSTCYRAKAEVCGKNFRRLQLLRNLVRDISEGSSSRVGRRNQVFFQSL